MQAATKLQLDLIDKFLISIHAAHAGCDIKKDDCLLSVDISIHAAHAGCDVFDGIYVVV